MLWIRRFIIVSLVLVVGLFVFLAYRFSKVETTGELRMLHRKAPNFKLESIHGRDSLALNELLESGKIVILNFWSSWCIPCEEEVSHLNDFYRDFKEEVELVGINVWDQRSKALEFMEKHDVIFPVLYAKNSPITVDYGINGVPETVVVDQEGYIRFHFKGPITYGMLKQVLQRLR